MLPLHFPAQEPDGLLTEIAGPGAAPLQYLRLRLVRLSAREPEWLFETGEREGVLDILSGTCTLNISAPSASATFPEIGGRQSVFAGRPTMVYLPVYARVSIFCEGEAFEGALITARAEQAYPAALVCPEEVETRVVGQDNWQRTVYTAIGAGVKAQRLIVGETINPPGNWSSAPPHKHDVDSGGEAAMEEIYHYRLNPAQGFGLQRVYTDPQAADPFDVTYAVRDGDTVAIPRGYHPLVAAPGYQLFYLWALAGERRAYGAWSDDPAHAWIKGSR